jgi:dihydroneopterin aldolase
MPSDWIRIVNMSLYGRHGAREEERRLGQHIAVDVAVAIDARRAGRSDDLAHTVSYGEIYDVVRQVEQQGPYNLLETLGQRIAEAVLARFAAQQVIVKVRKENPPVGGLADFAEVEICRKGRRKRAK